MSRSRLFVTGGRGFVGSAVVRRALAAGSSVTLLTRRPDALPADLASRVTVVAGELTDRHVIEPALADVEAVVHCARSDDADLEKRHHIDVEGTRALLDAATSAGVPRFVHLSTISVYPIVASGTIDENTPFGTSSDAYSRDKREVERLVLSTSGITRVVLQPSNIYGPGANWWSQGLLDVMHKGRVILVNGGSGIANLVHVDDVAQAIELAASGRGVNGGRYLLTDGCPRPWREYFEWLESRLGCAATVSMTVDEAKQYSAKVRHASLAGRVWLKATRALTGQLPIFPMDDDAIDRFASGAVFTIDRARRELGYEPQVQLERAPV